MKTKITLATIWQATKVFLYTTSILALILGNLFSAIITILPADLVGFGSTKTSILGYVAHCSFVPWSTIISLGFVALGVFLLIRLIKYLKSNEITFVKFLYMNVGVIVSILAVSFCFPFVLFLLSIYFLIKLFNHLKPKSSVGIETSMETSN